jgi:hypothetical protein
MSIRVTLFVVAALAASAQFSQAQSQSATAALRDSPTARVDSFSTRVFYPTERREPGRHVVRWEGPLPYVLVGALIGGTIASVVASRTSGACSDCSTKYPTVFVGGLGAIFGGYVGYLVYRVRHTNR